MADSKERANDVLQSLKDKKAEDEVVTKAPAPETKTATRTRSSDAKKRAEQ